MLKFESVSGAQSESRNAKNYHMLLNESSSYLFHHFNFKGFLFAFPVKELV